VEAKDRCGPVLSLDAPSGYRLLLDRRDLFAQFPGIALDEGLDHQRDVFIPLL